MNPKIDNKMPSTKGLLNLLCLPPTKLFDCCISLARLFRRYRLFKQTNSSTICVESCIHKLRSFLHHCTTWHSLTNFVNCYMYQLPTSTIAPTRESLHTINCLSLLPHHRLTILTTIPIDLILIITSRKMSRSLNDPSLLHRLKIRP